MSVDNDTLNLKVDLVLDQSFKSSHVHVPPRIDPDLYQAEIPDFIPQNIGMWSYFINIKVFKATKYAGNASKQISDGSSVKVFSQQTKNKDQVNGEFHNPPTSLLYLYILSLHRISRSGPQFD